MAGPTTEVLNEELKELRDSVHGFEVKMAGEFGRLDAKIDARFGRLEERLDNLKGISKWSIDRALPIVLAIFAFALTVAWYASKVDSRLSQVEQIKAEQPKR